MAGVCLSGLDKAGCKNEEIPSWTGDVAGLVMREGKVEF